MIETQDLINIKYNIKNIINKNFLFMSKYYLFYYTEINYLLFYLLSFLVLFTTYNFGFFLDLDLSGVDDSFLKSFYIFFDIMFNLFVYSIFYFSTHLFYIFYSSSSIETKYEEFRKKIEYKIEKNIKEKLNYKEKIILEELKISTICFYNFKTSMYSYYLKDLNNNKKIKQSINIIKKINNF